MPVTRKVHVRVDEAGKKGEVVAIDNGRALGNANRVARPDLGDTATLDHDDGRGDRIAAGSVDQPVGDDRERIIRHLAKLPKVVMRCVVG